MIVEGVGESCRSLSGVWLPSVALLRGLGSATGRFRAVPHPSTTTGAPPNTPAPRSRCCRPPQHPYLVSARPHLMGSPTALRVYPPHHPQPGGLTHQMAAGRDRSPPRWSTDRTPDAPAPAVARKLRRQQPRSPTAPSRPATDHPSHTPSVSRPQRRATTAVGPRPHPSEAHLRAVPTRHIEQKSPRDTGWLSDPMAEGMVAAGNRSPVARG